MLIHPQWVGEGESGCEPLVKLDDVGGVGLKGSYVGLEF
jgi:hypothetical protein